MTGEAGLQVDRAHLVWRAARGTHILLRLERWSRALAAAPRPRQPAMEGDMRMLLTALGILMLLCGLLYGLYRR